MYRSDFGYTIEESGNLMAVPYVFVVILSPFAGIIVERSRNKVRTLMVAPIMLFFSHILLAGTDGCYRCIYPIISVFLCGVGYAFLNASIWSIFTIICKQEILGTAMGVLYSTMNFGFAITSMIIGLLLDYVTIEKYEAVNVYLASLCFISLILTFILNYYDLRHTGILHSRRYCAPLLPNGIKQLEQIR